MQGASCHPSYNSLGWVLQSFPVYQAMEAQESKGKG
jgi:hypothetical protein